MLNKKRISNEILIPNSPYRIWASHSLLRLTVNFVKSSDSLQVLLTGTKILMLRVIKTRCVTKCNPVWVWYMVQRHWSAPSNNNPVLFLVIHIDIPAFVFSLHHSQEVSRTGGVTSKVLISSLRNSSFPSLWRHGFRAQLEQTHRFPKCRALCQHPTKHGFRLRTLPLGPVTGHASVF